MQLAAQLVTVYLTYTAVHAIRIVIMELNTVPETALVVKKRYGNVKL
jgi:hypothetical protein